MNHQNLNTSDYYNNKLMKKPNSSNKLSSNIKTTTPSSQQLYNNNEIKQRPFSTEMQRTDKRIVRNLSRRVGMHKKMDQNIEYFLRKKLKIPSHLKIVGGIALGYPKKEPNLKFAVPVFINCASRFGRCCLYILRNSRSWNPQNPFFFIMRNQGFTNR